jgi:predicted aspartyl protease
MLLTSLLFAAVLQDAPAPAAPPPLNLSRPPATPAATPPTATPPPRTTTVRAGLPKAGVQPQPAPYETVGGLILVRGRLLGKPVWALLDTGSARSVVDLSFAEGAGLKIGPPEGSVALPSGEAPLRFVPGVSFIVPKQIGVLEAEFTAMDLDRISKTIGRKIDFVLGFDVLSRFAVTIDPVTRTLSFGKPGETPPPAGATAIPFVDQRRLDVTVSGKPIRVALDIGSSSTLILNPEAWGRIGPKDAALTSGRSSDASGMAMRVRRAEVSEVSLGGFTRRDAQVNVQPWPAAMGDGALGMGFLAGFPMMIDVTAGKLWLAPKASVAP